MIVPAITFRILSPTVPVNDRFTGLPAISQFCELVTFVVAWALTDLGGRTSPLDMRQICHRDYGQVPLTRRKCHKIERNRPAAIGSNELGEALPPNGIRHTTGHSGKQRKPPAVNQRVRGSKP
jgi:hypothetical protein